MMDKITLVNQRFIYTILFLFHRLLGHAKDFINIVALSLFYFFIITPMALVLRVLQKDLLNLKINKLAKTYWIKNSPQTDQINFEDQF